MRHIGQQFHQARVSKKWSQSTVAQLAHLTQAMVSKVESGKDVQLSTLLALAKVLELEIVAITSKQAFALRRQYSSTTKKQTLLEQFQVSDDD